MNVTDATVVTAQVSQTLVNLAIVVTVGIYARQLRTMRAQLATMQQQMREESVTAINRNLVDLLKFIHDPGFRKARRVLVSLAGKPLNLWSEEEKAQGERACAACDLVAVQALQGIVPKDLIVQNNYFLRECFDAAAELIPAVRSEHQQPNKWKHFSDLAQEIPTAARRSGDA